MGDRITRRIRYPRTIRRFNAVGDAFNPSDVPRYYYDNQERTRDWYGSVPC